MAGLGFKTFNAGDVLTAAQVQGYLQDQSVMKFASATARTSALASPTQGMVSFLSDSNSFWQYYEVYNSATNPGGASVAGWYPQENTVLFAGKRSNTGLSLANNAYTVISFNTFACAGSTSNTTTIQTNSATAPSTFVVRQAGWYELSISAYGGDFASTAGTQRNAAFNRNSATATTNQLGGDSTTNLTSGWLYPTTNVLLAAGDTIRFYLYQDSGGATTNNNTNATITYLKPASV